MRLLKTYEQAAGQEINLSKSEVFFSRNLSLAGQEDLSRIMGVRKRRFFRILRIEYGRGSTRGEVVHCLEQGRRL
jgi:hypothetical protein